MKKEFEKNNLEKDLEFQDEIDDETFQKILEEEFMEREKQIEEALFADDDFEDLELTDEEVKNSYQELIRRFEKEKKESAELSEELVPDEKLVRRVLDEKAGSSDAHEEKKVLPMEEVRERRKKSTENGEDEAPDSKIADIRSRKNGTGLHRFGRVVGMAAVAVACVFAASMTSEANRTYLVNSVRILSGDDTQTVVDNDESNETANLNENKAISDIEEQLNVKIPIFYYRPHDFGFSDYKIDKEAGIAWLEYKYLGNSIIWIIDKQSTKTASKTNSLDGDGEENTIIRNEGISISIKKIYNSDNTFNYSAEWSSDETLYLLFGKIELEEMKKIVEKMKF